MLPFYTQEKGGYHENTDCLLFKGRSHAIALARNGVACVPIHCVNQDINCGCHYDGYEIWKQEELPKCEACGGEILPWPLYSHISLWDADVRKARTWIAKADLLLVIGTNGYYIS